MSTITTYIVLIAGVICGVISNSAAKSADGFTIILPSLISVITIIICMVAISYVSKTIPIGTTYASFAGLAIIATVIVGVIKFNQVPNIYTVIGLILIIAGVLMVNLLGNK